MKQMKWKLYVVFGVMIAVMLGLMAAFGLMLGGASPMALLMSSGTGQGLSMWRVMLVPVVGVLIMGSMMVISFRWMAGRGEPMSSLMGRRTAPQPVGDAGIGATHTYTIPGVSCAHCKMTIEREVGKLPGVASVSVDVDTQQAVVQLVSPPTRKELERYLTKIGYEPEDQ